MEKRNLSAPVELRAAGEGGTGKIATGYAILYNVETDIGWFREKFAPGAFSAALKGDIRALFNHDTGRLLGRTTAGTLRLVEDDKGVNYEIDLPDTTDGRDLAVSLERRDITGSSFAFVPTREEWDETVDPPLRTILEGDLFEVSPVTFPAYEDTTAALRSLEGVRERMKARQNFAGAAERLRRKANLDHVARRTALKRP